VFFGPDTYRIRALPSERWLESQSSANWQIAAEWVAVRAAGAIALAQLQREMPGIGPW